MAAELPLTGIILISEETSKSQVIKFNNFKLEKNVWVPIFRKLTPYYIGGLSHFKGHNCKTMSSIEELNMYHNYKTVSSIEELIMYISDFLFYKEISVIKKVPTLKCIEIPNYFHLNKMDVSCRNLNCTYFMYFDLEEGLKVDIKTFASNYFKGSIEYGIATSGIPYITSSILDMHLKEDGNIYYTENVEMTVTEAVPAEY